MRAAGRLRRALGVADGVGVGQATGHPEHRGDRAAQGPSDGDGHDGAQQGDADEHREGPEPEQSDDGHGLVGDPEPRDDEAGSEDA